MSRPVALVFLLLILVLTSQFEWKQQFASDSQPETVFSKQNQLPKNKEVLKEQTILYQEKKIHELNELVKKMQQQLLDCKASNTINDSPSGANVDSWSSIKEFQED